MKRNKFIFVFVLLLSILLVFSSCNKKEGESENKSVASSIISSESKSSREPIVVVPSPEKKEEVKAEEKVEVKPAEVKVEETKTEEVKAEETAAPSKEEEKVVETVFVEDEEKPVVESVFSYRGIVSNVSAYTDHAYFTLQDGITSSDIEGAIALLVDAYPDLAVLVTYNYSDGLLVLYYPVVEKDTIETYLNTLFDEARYYINYLFASLEESTQEETKVEEVVVAKVDSTPLEETEKTEEAKTVLPVEVVSKPVEESTKKAGLPLSLSASLFGSYDLKTRAFGYGLKVGAYYDCLDNLSLGLKLGYDLNKYLSVAGSVKYNFIKSAYASLSLGWTFDFDKTRKNSSLLIDLAAGYACSITESLSLTVEGGVVYYPLLSHKLVPSITLGLSYNF